MPQSELPPDARLHHNDAEDEALLIVCSIELGVVAIVGAKMNSGEDLIRCKRIYNF
jgi:hypothetical protein